MTASAQEDNERRAYPRHPIRDSSALMLSPDNIISFRLLNISESGMAFSYNGKGLNSNLQDDAFVDLFAEIVGVESLPVKIISDTEIDLVNVWFPNSAEDDGITKLPYLRRCGVEFDELSEAQKQAIGKYIQSLQDSM